jgi:MFS family permease
MKSAIWVVWALGITQVVGYGTLYYSFGALAPSMARDFGLSEAWVYGALSASLLVSGLVAPISGRWADRFGAGRQMAWGSVAAALALCLTALAPEAISFVLGLVAIEVASAFVLYATAFAALAQVDAASAQRRITQLTLIAGFASTLFWPVTSALHGVIGWRGVYLVYAALNLTVCLPIHIWLSARTRPVERHGSPTAAVVLPLVPVAAQGRALVLVLLAFALLGFVFSAVLVHMLPMLASLGLGAAGVLVTTLFGPAQVLSRVVNMRFGRDLSQPALALLAALLPPTGLAILVLTAPWPPGAAAFAIVFGLGTGLSSIVLGTLPLALFGAKGYGQKLGWISSARLVVSAFAPFIFSVAVGLTSTGTTLWMLALVGLAAAGCYAAIWWAYGRNTPVRQG